MSSNAIAPIEEKRKEFGQDNADGLLQRRVCRACGDDCDEVAEGFFALAVGAGSKEGEVVGELRGGRWRGGV